MPRRSYAATRLTRLPAPATTAQPVSPLGQAVAALATLATGILDGTIQPCPACGRFDCDCDEWPELMYTDPTATELRH